MPVFFGKKTWTISDIYNTTQERQFKSAGCTVNYLGVSRSVKSTSILDKWKSLFFRNKSLMKEIEVIFSFQVISNESGKTYPVKIQLLYDPFGNLIEAGKIKVYCGCPDFKFGCAYVLNNHEALFKSEKTDIDLGPAITTAPKRKRDGILCKHSYAALRYLIQNYNQLMSYV